MRKLFCFVALACSAQVQTPLKVNQSAGSLSGQLWIQEPRSGGVDWWKLSVPALAASLENTVPSAHPTANGQVLTSTTAGVWSWANASRIHYLRTDDYDFDETNGAGVSGDLSAAGSKTLTFAGDCPDGVDAANAGRHWVYIYGGTGTAEAVNITGGTCPTSGGTITVTTSNTHTGSWHVATATAGLQEAFYARVPSDLFIPDGAWDMHAPLIIYGQGGSTTRIVGAGSIASRLVRASNFLAGDMIYYNGTISTGDLVLSDFGMTGGDASIIPTSGTNIHLNEAYTTWIERLRVLDGYRQFHMEGTGGLIHVVNNEFRYTAAYLAAAVAGGAQPSEQLLINGATIDLKGNEIVQSISGSSYSDAVPAVRVLRGDGHTISDNRIGGLDGIQFDHGGAHPMNFIYVVGNVFNGIYRFGVYFTNSSASGQEYQNIFFSANDIITQFLFPPYTAGGPTQHYGIYANSADLKGVSVTGGIISGWGNDCILVNDGTNWVISGVTIRDCNGAAGTGSGIQLSGTGTNINITSNWSGYIRDTLQTSGLYIVGTQTALNVVGNNFSANAVAPIALVSSPTVSGTFAANTGVDDATALIASGSLSASGAAAAWRTIEVSGTTAVTSLTPVWDGRKITLVKTDSGAVEFTTAGNFASAMTLRSKSSMQCQYYATQTKWNCNGIPNAPTITGITTIGADVATVRLGQKFNVNASNTYAGLAVNTWSVTGGEGSVIDFNKSGSSVPGTHTAVVDGNSLGFFVFRGSDGTDFRRAAEFNGEVDGAVSAGIVPGRMRFRTANSSGTMTERLRIDSAGVSAFTGNVTITGTFGVNGVASLNGSSNFMDGTLKPAFDGNGSIGTSSARYGDYYGYNLNVSGTITFPACTTVGHVLTAGASGVMTCQAATGSSTFADNVFRVQDDGDATKQIAFQANAITTGTTRTLAVQNASYELAGTNIAQTYTALQTYSNGIATDTISISNFLQMGSTVVFNSSRNMVGVNAIQQSLTFSSTGYNVGSSGTPALNVYASYVQPLTELVMASGVTFGGNLIPTANNTYAVGNTSYRLSTVVTTNANISGTITAPDGFSGLSITKTVRASGGGSDCNLVFSGGLLTSSTC